jgi:hypothetical protein
MTIRVEVSVEKISLGNWHVPFLWGWELVTVPSYPTHKFFEFLWFMNT